MEITLEDFIDNKEFETNGIFNNCYNIEKELPSVVGMIFE